MGPKRFNRSRDECALNQDDSTEHSIGLNSKSQIVFIYYRYYACSLRQQLLPQLDRTLRRDQQADCNGPGASLWFASPVRWT